jgi:hypothetical protein
LRNNLFYMGIGEIRQKLPGLTNIKGVGELPTMIINFFCLDFGHGDARATPCNSMGYASKKPAPPPSKYRAKLPQNAKKV